MESLVSIIMPVYNGQNYVEYAIKSAIKQTYRNIEIIIVNDGSIDNTKNIISKYKDINNVKIYNKTNGGIGSALNYGIERANGEFITWLSHDDIYESDRIETQILLYKNLDNKNSIIVGDFGSIDKGGNKIPSISRLVPGFYSGKETFKKYLAGQTDINGCAVLVRKDFFDTYGMFSDYAYIQDKAMWINFMLNDICFYFDKKNIVKTRRHNEQTTITKKDMFKVEDENFCLEMINRLYNTDKSFLLLDVWNYCYVHNYNNCLLYINDKIDIPLKEKYAAFLKKSYHYIILNNVKYIYHKLQRKI